MNDKFFLDILTLKTEMNFKGYSVSTQETYKRAVVEFLEYTDKEITDIKREDIIRFLDDNLKTLSTNTVLVKLNALEFFFGEILGLEIAENIRKYKREFKVKDFLTPEQLDLLVSSVPPRERLLYKIIIETGMTVDEAVELKIKDLFILPKKFLLRGYKISKNLARDITDYGERKFIDGYIFFLGDGHIDSSAARHWLREYTKKIFNKVYSFNDIRHSVGLEMIKKGEEEKAAKYLKNKSVSGIRQFYKRAGYDYMEK